MTCFLNMNLLFLSPRRLIPPCTCSVTPAGAARICKHSWCVSASERSHLTSPRRSSPSPRMPRITQIHGPGGGRGTCSWCRLIRGAQCFCQTFCWKSYRNEVTQGAGNLVHFFRPCEPRSVFSLSWFAVSKWIFLHSTGQSSYCKPVSCLFPKRHQKNPPQAGELTCFFPNCRRFVCRCSII